VLHLYYSKMLLTYLHYTKFQASAVVEMRSLLFGVVIKCMYVVVYRSFATAYWSLLDP